MDAQPDEKVAYRSQSEDFSGPGPANIESNKFNRQPAPLTGKKLIEAKRRAQALKAQKKMSKTGQPF